MKLVEKVLGNDNTACISLDSHRCGGEGRFTENTLVISKESLELRLVAVSCKIDYELTMSVAHATVTHTVSHVPVMPKYGFPEPNILPVLEQFCNCFLKKRDLMREIALQQSNTGQQTTYTNSLVELLRAAVDPQHGL